MSKRKPQARRPSKTDSSSVRARARKAPPVPATAVAPTPEGFGAVALADANVDLQAEDLARRYASLLRLSQDAIHVRRLSGQIEFWNDGAEELYGFTEQEVLGKNVHEILQTVGSTSTAEVDAILARVGHWEGELVSRSKQGRTLTVAVRMQLVRGEDGIERILQSGHDISERKQTEQALHDSQTRLAAIVDSIADGFYALDRQWRVTHMNDTALRYFHKSREDVLGRSLFELFPAFVGSVFEIELRRAMESGAPIRVHAPSVTTDRTVELFGYPSPDTLTVLFRDVTKRELQARRVQQLTQLYAVLSQANEMIVRTRDEAHIFQEVCRIVAEQMALPLAWIGLVEGRLVKPVAASGPSAAYLGGITVEVQGELGRGPTGTCIREDRAMVNDDFESNPLLSPWRESALRHGIRASAAFPLHKKGKAVGALTLYSQQRAAFDSEQVELLLALAADVSYALDAIEAGRQRAEAEHALQESERELRNADARKNEFLAMLSHELRNPLAPIKNSLYILQHVRGDGEQVQRAESVIERQVAHLTSLVDDLLDVTRVTRGKIRLEKEPVNLDELVGRTVEDHRDLFARAGVKLALRTSGARLMVHADRTRLTQVVGNLLQNAVKFTPKGGATTMSIESRGNGQAALRVCDTGSGISADILPHLFEPFTQADRTLDRSKGGLGLGLALVKGLVEMHDGSVAAQSEGPGKGAEFEVVLPTIPPSEIAEPRPPIEQAPVQPRRVLIIEDNRDAADSLREVLDLLNHSAMVAYSGDEGLAKSRAYRPDVILCDIGLPGMDGHEVARAIRADATLSSTTLVALTGYASPEDLAKSQEAGFDYHLAKPPSIEAIEQVLARAMRRTGPPSCKSSEPVASDLREQKQNDLDVSEHRRADEALRASEARFRSVLNDSRDVIYRVNVQTGRYEYVSPSAEAVVGYSPDELMAMDVEKSQAMIHPDDAPAMRAAVARLETSGTADVEHRQRAKDGDYRWLSNHMSLVKDSSGQPLYRNGNIRDITEQKAAEQTRARLLAEVEKRAAELDATVSSLATGLIVYNRTGRATRMNSTAQELLSAELFANSTVEERHRVVHWETEDGKPFPLEEIPVARALRGETVHNVVIAAPFPDHKLWISASAAPIRTPDGEMLGAVASFVDLTEHKRAEAALRASERRYRAIGESIDYGVWVCAPDGRNTYASQSFLDLVGLTQQQCSSFGWGDVLHPDDAERTIAAWKECIRTGGVWDIEHRFRGVDGKWHPILARGVPVKDEQGKITCWAGINLDISALKKTEEALREADRRKNEFLAMLSHELRNPLAPIRNSTYVLEHCEPGGEQARRALAVIDRQAGQLAHLVDDLLEVTRITWNRIQLQRQTLDLNELVCHTVEDHRTLFDRADVRVEFHSVSQPMFVSADRKRLAQVIGNLLQNAAKFTGRGGETRITISTDATGKWAVIHVADTGVGMTPELVARLFQPFSQADSTLDRSKGGLGLGLALAKGVVELHGGDITARSAGLGQGAEFVVRLPLATDDAVAPRPTTSASKSRRRVLIIEDNVDAADSLRDVLAFGGHVVEVAYNGPQGIAKAREFRPEVVLCDIGLSMMDGFEVAHAFRADEALKGVFLVALSGYALPEDVARAQAAGFDQHLAKPPSLEKLEEVMESRPGS